MLSGRRLDLLKPSPDDIAIEDIAHGLARVARWNGQTAGNDAFSVAQHSLIVEQIVSTRHSDWERRWQLAALLHDAPEYVVGDLISPFKAAIGFDYKAFELRLLEAIHVRFGLPSRLPEDVAHAIKLADRVSAFFEATRLAGFALDEAERFFGGTPTDLPPALMDELDRLEPTATSRAQAAFLSRFTELL